MVFTAIVVGLMVNSTATAPPTEAHTVSCYARVPNPPVFAYGMVGSLVQVTGRVTCSSTLDWQSTLVTGCVRPYSEAFVLYCHNSDFTYLNPMLGPVSNNSVDFSVTNFVPCKSATMGTRGWRGLIYHQGFHHNFDEKERTGPITSLNCTFAW